MLHLLLLSIFVFDTTITPQHGQWKLTFNGSPVFIEFPSGMTHDPVTETTYILDGRAGVALMIRDGVVLRKFAGKGQGPGELSWPGDISMTSQDILITDSRGMKINFYSKSGDFLRAVQVPGLPAARVVQTKSGWFLTHQKERSMYMNAPGQPETALGSFLGKDGDLIGQIAKPYNNPDGYINALFGDVIPLLHGDVLFLVHTIKNKITMVENGKIQDTLTGPLDFHPVEPATEKRKQGERYVVFPRYDKIVLDAVAIGGNAILLNHAENNHDHTKQITPKKILHIFDLENARLEKSISVSRDSLLLAAVNHEKVLILTFEDDAYFLTVQEL